MSVPSITNQTVDLNRWTMPINDKAIIDEILLKDPWCKMPSTDVVEAYIRNQYPALTDMDISRIAKKLEPELESNLRKEVINFEL